jgi:hypothetical protein
MVEEETIWEGSSSWKGELSFGLSSVLLLFTVGFGLLVYISYLLRRPRGPNIG